MPQLRLITQKHLDKVLFQQLAHFVSRHIFASIDIIGGSLDSLAKEVDHSKFPDQRFVNHPKELLKVNLG